MKRSVVVFLNAALLLAAFPCCAADDASTKVGVFSAPNWLGSGSNDRGVFSIPPLPNPTPYSYSSSCTGSANSGTSSSSGYFSASLPYASGYGCAPLSWGSGALGGIRPWLGASWSPLSYAGMWGGYGGWGGWGSWLPGSLGWGGLPGSWASGPLNWGGWGGYPGGWGGGWGGWWNPGASALYMGAFGTHLHRHEPITSQRVIQTVPSKPSGNYYAPSTVDPTASGSYYASSGQAPVPVYQTSPPPPKDYWGSTGSPFPKDLTSTPWSQ